MERAATNVERKIIFHEDAETPEIINLEVLKWKHDK